ncbi:MAG: SDR family oxidoreductase [Candidatus Nanohaloarchaea archaeon]
MKSLDNQTAVVTGASSGIGKATCKELAKEKVNLVLASRSKEKLVEISEDIEERFDVETKVVETDVTRKEDVENLFEETVEEFGEPDIVVNNAGLTYSGDVADMDYEDYEKTMAVNVDGMFYVAKNAIDHLEETKGNLIFLGSIAGQYPRGTNPVYAGTKWWTRGFALSLESQIGDKDIGVTIINPSEVRTKFNSETGKAFEKEFEEGEVTEASDVAEAVVYASKQEERNTVSEIDLYRRDKLSDFTFK